MGLRLRVILILTVPLMLAVAIHGALRVRREEAQLLREDRLTMDLAAGAIQIALQHAVGDGHMSDVRRMLVEIVEQQESIDRIRLFDVGLHPTIVSNPLSIGETIPTAALERVIKTGASELLYERGTPSFLYYLAPLHGRKGTIDGAMEIVRLGSSVDRRLGTAITDVWLRLGILLVMVVVVTGLAMQAQVVRPLARLMRGIQALGRGEPGPPLPVKRRDELGRVAEAFNEMTVRLDVAQRRLLAETERALELERELQQAATLAVAGKLASALAHEVGTPLNVIGGRAEYVLKTLSEGAEGRQDLEIIIGQIDRISRIIRSLLDTVRPQKPQPIPTSIADALDRLLPLLNYSARQRGVTLLTAVPDGLPPIFADPGQIQQVLINLVLNALEATDAGGEVTVKAQKVDRDRGPGIEIGVADTGAGIPPEILPRAFEPFVTTKARGQGTGLGLAICRDIVQTNGGDIRVETEVGRGSTFRVWMPAAEDGHA